MDEKYEVEKPYKLKLKYNKIKHLKKENESDFVYYYRTNEEFRNKQKERMKIYNEKNKIKCECGKSSFKTHYQKHLKSSFHLKYLESEKVKELTTTLENIIKIKNNL